MKPLLLDMLLRTSILNPRAIWQRDMRDAGASLHTRDAAQHDYHAVLIGLDLRPFCAGCVQDRTVALPGLDYCTM